MRQGVSSGKGWRSEIMRSELKGKEMRRIQVRMGPQGQRERRKVTRKH